MEKHNLGKWMSHPSWAGIAGLIALLGLVVSVSQCGEVKEKEYLVIKYDVPHNAGGKSFKGVVTCEIPIANRCERELEPDHVKVWQHGGKLVFHVFAKQEGQVLKYWAQITHKGELKVSSNMVESGPSKAALKLPFNGGELEYSITVERDET